MPQLFPTIEWRQVDSHGMNKNLQEKTNFELASFGA